MPNGYIFYRGPSLIDGKPIIGVIVGFNSDSANRKTGAMLQTYILPADIAPHEAVKTGADVSVCGGCIHRPTVAKQTGADPCYVFVAQGPLIVWKTAQAGKYADVTPEQFGQLVAGRMLRLGSWGEPVAIPFEVWQPAIDSAAGRTGYTHRWRTRKASQWQGTLQASCDSAEDFEDAVQAGWGTFRVAVPGYDETVSLPEVHCPASKEQGAKVQCQDCLLCDGSSSSNIVILSHGPRHRRKVAALA